MPSLHSLSLRDGVTSLTDVPRVVLIEVGTVVVLSTGETTTSWVLAVLSDTTVTAVVSRCEGSEGERREEEAASEGSAQGAEGGSSGETKRGAASRAGSDGIQGDTKQEGDDSAVSAVDRGPKKARPRARRSATTKAAGLELRAAAAAAACSDSW